MKIAVVQLQPTVPNHNVHTTAPRYGLLVVANAMRQAGHDTIAVDEYLTPDVEALVEDADLVGITVLSCWVEKANELADRCRKRGQLVVMGGSASTFRPMHCLPHADFVVFGDGEMTFVELVRRIEAGLPTDDLPGIAWMDGATPRMNKLTTRHARYQGTVDPTILVGYEDFLRQARARDEYAPIPFNATRGCTFRCNFCPAPLEFGNSFYRREVDEVLDDLEVQLRYTDNIYFVDNYLGGNPRYFKELLEGILDRGLKMNASSFQRCELSLHDDLLELMRRAGFDRVILGVEALSDEGLVMIEKRTTVTRNLEFLDRYRRHGFDVHGSFIQGIGRETFEVAASYGRIAREEMRLDLADFHAFTPLFNGKDEHPERYFRIPLRFVTGHFPLYLPSHMRPSQLARAVARSYGDFYSDEHLERRRRGGATAVQMNLLERFHAYGPLLEAAAQEYAELTAKLEETYYRGDVLDAEKARSQPPGADVATAMLGDELWTMDIYRRKPAAQAEGGRAHGRA
jgi:radical SAM superfamily enzyme YgiQ (UPF0313 family)